MSSRVRLLPREHGTWAMLLVPWAVGVGVAGGVRIAHLLLLIAALAFFLAHHHVMTWWRARADARAVSARFAVLFGAVGLLAGAPLVFVAGIRPLLPYAAVVVVLTGVALSLVARRLDRALPGQMLAAVGLPLAAPVAWTVAHGVVDRVALALWLLNAAFFAGAVLYVRLKIEARARRAPLTDAAAKLAFAWPTLAADAALVVVAWLAIRLGGFSPLALVAFATVAVQAVAGVVRLDRPAPLKQVGIIATLHAVVFAILVIGLA
jgi:hypothetical protein